MFLLDFFALQAKEYRWVVEQLPKVYALIWGEHELVAVSKHIPNLCFSEPLASFLLLGFIYDEKEQKFKVISINGKSETVEEIGDKKTSEYADVSARLRQAILRFPALAYVLAFGEDVGTSLEALEQLYVERCSSQWRVPHVAQWLHTILLEAESTAVDGSLTIEDAKQAMDEMETLSSLMSPEQQLTICRHAYLSGLSRTYWPLPDWARTTKVDETIWAFDPFPPLSTIHPTPVDTFFNGVNEDADDQGNVEEPSWFSSLFTSALRRLHLY